MPPRVAGNRLSSSPKLYDTNILLMAEYRHYLLGGNLPNANNLRHFEDKSSKIHCLAIIWKKVKQSFMAPRPLVEWTCDQQYQVLPRIPENHIFSGYLLRKNTYVNTKVYQLIHIWYGIISDCNWGTHFCFNILY